MIEKQTHSLLDRALEVAGTVCAVVLLLRFAWEMVQPLIPVLIVLAIVGAAIAMALAYYHRRW